VCRCVPLCAAVCRCVPLCAAVCLCVPLCASVCLCVPLCAAVCRCVPLCASVCLCVPLCAAVCLCTHKRRTEAYTAKESISITIKQKCVPLFEALYIRKRALHTRKRAPCSNVMGNFKEHGAYELCLSDMWVSFADKKSPVYPQKSPMFKCNGYSQRTWCVRVMSLKYVGLFCG